jgi:predicted nucleic acid-binding protein
MSQTTQSSAGAVVVDANIFISICSKEPTEGTARTALADYALRNWAFYAPNVIFAEVLFALCRKGADGTLDAASYKRCVDDFRLSFLPKLLPPPMGDAALYARAEEIRSGYSCPHTSDSFYLALTEDLAKIGPAEFLTFDKRVVNVAAKNAPTVKVNLLPS